MTTPAIIVGVASAIGAIVSALFGGGLLTKYVKNSNELAVLKYISETTKAEVSDALVRISKLERQSAETHATVTRYEEQLKKLEIIPELKAQLMGLRDLVGSVQELVMNLTRNHIQGS